LPDAERAGLQVGSGYPSFFQLIDPVILRRRYDTCGELQQTGAIGLLIFRDAHPVRCRQADTIDMMNMVRYFLPHLLALSTVRPFWMGRNTD